MNAIRFDPSRLVAREPLKLRQSYTVRDTIIYALGVGAAVEPEFDLRYLYEEGLQALPTMAAVLGHPGFWQRDPQYGIQWQKILHGEQSIIMHKPLPPSGEVVATFRIKAVYDKGVQKGSVVHAERKLADSTTGDLIATITQGSFLLANGGAGTAVADDHMPFRKPILGDRAADFLVDMRTRPEQAVIYRLSGDMYPLHIDPDFAAAAGFKAPILHGLCTYGVAARAVIATLCGNEPSRLRRFDTRFSSPVYPGETISIEIWRDGIGKALFRARVIERDSVVLDNGYVEYDCVQ